ncbi:AcrR family transcriptional regulator [Streptacidiphilus sp. MAP12-33]|uniref:TetR family transcriptional regulator n=1 Tax=Streptacidiphilus sp. MAP12-33 TaxID=3156266 RepID=UPI0035112D30
MAQERAVRTRERVLDAAAEAFATRGFAQTTLETVVAGTGVSKGALYGHFRSKEELARALVAHAGNAWGMLLAQAGHGARDPLEALRVLTIGLAARLGADMRLRAAVRLASELPPDQHDLGDPLGPLPARMAELAALAQADRTVSPGHTPAAVATLLLATVVGAQALPGLRIDQELPVGIEDLWPLLEAGLRAQPAPGADAETLTAS